MLADERRELLRARRRRRRLFYALAEARAALVHLLQLRSRKADGRGSSWRCARAVRTHAHSLTHIGKKYGRKERRRAPFHPRDGAGGEGERWSARRERRRTRAAPSGARAPVVGRACQLPPAPADAHTARPHP
eukprot:3180243-Prymnesium_polylepis.1